MLTVFKSLFIKLTPPSGWKVPVLIICGTLSGIVLFLLYISNVPSYLSDKPETCINCHIMVPQYAAWSHSSHREKTNCNDCHVPHDYLVNKYLFKASDGLRHAAIFTLRAESQVIRIGDDGSDVVQQNCLRCHEYLFTDSKTISDNKMIHSYRTERKCITCHRETAHGTVNSLSATPFARAPLLSSPVPEWLKDLLTNNKNQIQ